MKSLLIALLALLTALGFAQAEKKVDLKKLEKTYLAAKAALDKKPKDKKVKDQFVMAGVKYGHESMMSPELPPSIKYKQALRIYKEVLKVDPKNPVATKESDLIKSIYRQMGRPIPD